MRNLEWHIYPQTHYSLKLLPYLLILHCWTEVFVPLPPKIINISPKFILIFLYSSLSYLLTVFKIIMQFLILADVLTKLIHTIHNSSLINNISINFCINSPLLHKILYKDLSFNFLTLKLNRLPIQNTLTSFKYTNLKYLPRNFTNLFSKEILS